MSGREINKFKKIGYKNSESNKKKMSTIKNISVITAHYIFDTLTGNTFPLIASSRLKNISKIDIEYTVRF